MLRLVIGLLKGAILGGAVGYGAHALGLAGVFHWVTYGLVGLVVGLLVGRPFWSHFRDHSSTVVVAILKSVFGFGIGAGLYALASRLAADVRITLGEESRLLVDWQFLLGATIGGVYGAFIELDDAPRAKAAAAGKPAGPGEGQGQGQGKI